MRGASHLDRPMNYLGHYVYNHEIRRLTPHPYFILGAALPDLWPRFSRRRRLRWKAVREAEPADPRARRLRAGLLNHVMTDRRFHSLPSFNRWRGELKSRCFGDDAHSALVDFLAHLAIELALDHRIMIELPHVGGEIYERIALCDFDVVEQEIGAIGAVDAAGLADVTRRFVARRFLPYFARFETIPRVMDFVLNLTDVREKPAGVILESLASDAARIVDPQVVWSEMVAGEPETADKP